MKRSLSKMLGAAALAISAAAILANCTGEVIQVCPAGAAAGSNCCPLNPVACVAPEFLYVTAADKVITFNVNTATGVPSLQGSIAGPHDPRGEFAAFGNSAVYVSDFAGNGVAGFGANAGSLTVLPGSPFAGVAGPAGLASNGQFLFVANSGGNSVSVFSVGQTAALTAIAGSPFAAASGPKAAAFGSIHFLYVSNFTDPQGRISGYAVDANTGVLTPVPGSPFATQANAGPNGIISPGAGKFLYVALTNNNLIAGFSIDSNTGALTPVAASPTAAGSQPVGLASDAIGSFLYVTNGSANTVSGFAIAADGSLIPVPGSPFSTGSGPSSIAFDGFQRIYVANSGGNSVSGYSIAAATGALTPLSGSPFNVGTQPISIATAR